MRALEYILKGMENSVSYDEAGNMYIDTSNLLWSASVSLDILNIDTNDTIVFISKEDCDRYNQYEIIVPEDIDYDSVRRPYYRMRGKPVTREQAFDIIRRTDNFFCYINDIDMHADYVGCFNFDNWLIDKNHYPFGYGWIHVDGTVGANAITQKYPEVSEFVSEWFYKLLCFPYLDLVIAVTNWNEVPDELWCLSCFDDSYESKHREFEMDDKNFYRAVVVGIYIHDKTLEILRPSDAVAKYREYASLYGKNREIYISDYYDKRGIKQVDLPYLKKCIEAYGLDAEEVLSKEHWHE